jgi:7-carboxy-7-deazaguanine synthase
VTEIFHSIQGESTHAGRPCVFVRLTGCPLRCTWCDTAYSFYGGVEMALVDVLARVRAYGCPLVEVTGGEPLHQPEAFDLITALCDAGHEVLIETSGAVDITPVDRRARIILDVKCPGSGMMDRMDWKNLERLRAGDEIKFVIKDRADYDWARGVLDRDRLTGRFAVLFSPVHGELEPRALSEWVLSDRLPVRVQLQMHKYIWDPDTRGV